MLGINTIKVRHFVEQVELTVFAFQGNHKRATLQEGTGEVCPQQPGGSGYQCFTH
jgi:hypothetical protein